MRAKLFVSVIACSLVGGSFGCVMSLEPLSDAKTSLSDKRLIGVWEAADDKNNDKNGDKNARYRVEAVDKASATYRITQLDSGNKQKPLTLLLTELENRRYLSIGGFDDEKNRETWLIAQYEWLSDHSLRLRVMDLEVVQSDVKAKRIKGQLETGGSNSNKSNESLQIDVTWVMLHEPTADLRRFIAANAGRIFNRDWVSFRRVDPQ